MVFALCGCGGGGSGGSNGSSNDILPDPDNYGGYMDLVAMPASIVYLEDGISYGSESDLVQIELNLYYTHPVPYPIIPSITSCSFVRKNIDGSISHVYSQTAVPNPLVQEDPHNYNSLTDLEGLLGPLSFNYSVVNNIPAIIDVSLGEDHISVNDNTAITKTQITTFPEAPGVEAIAVGVSFPFETRCTGSDGFVYKSNVVTSFIAIVVANYIHTNQ
jgi:hypothetical protein